MKTTTAPIGTAHMDGSQTTDGPEPVRSGGRWVFLSRSALPADPTARRLEKRGRWWLVLSYVLCPCHLPVTLGLAGLAFGGTALGTVIAGNALWVGILLTVAYAVVLWRGFRQLRRARRALAAGESLRCTPEACTIVSGEFTSERASGAPLSPDGVRPAGGFARDEHINRRS